MLLVIGAICADEPVSFTKQIAPILKAKCVPCHGPKLAESDYRVDTFNFLMASGISAGETDESDFFDRLITTDQDVRMPAESDQLPMREIEMFRKWIQEGAAFDGGSKDASLEQLLPRMKHPDPPEAYPSSLPISAIASDGKQVFVSGYHEITAWSLDGKLVRRITDQGQRTYSIDLHPNRARILSASGTPGELGEVRLFDLESGKPPTVVQKAGEVIMDARYSPDGKKIAIAMPDGSIRILNSDSFEEQTRLVGHSDAVVAIDWHRDGVRLATASRDASAKVFDTNKGQSIATFTGHNECVNGVKFLDDQQLISVSDDGTAQRWKIDGGRREQVVLSQARTPVLSVSVSENSFLLCGAIPTHQYKLGSNQLLQRDDAPDEWVTTSGILLADSEDIFLTGTQTGLIRIWFSDKEKEASEFRAIPR